MLVFAKGTLDSVAGIWSVVSQISLMSGLQLNSAISVIYSSRIANGEIEEIREIIGFKVGKLPVSYLGIPLVTRKLSEWV